MSAPSFRNVLKNPGFVNIWMNQILLQLAYNSLNFALLIWVYKITNSNTAVATLMFAIYLPAVIFGLFAGVLVDIIDRKKVIIWINILLCLSFVALDVVKGSFGLLLLMAFIINTLAQFYTSAEASAIPLLVKEKELLVANSLFSTTLFMTFLLGFGISGPLYAKFGITTIFYMEAFLLVIACILSFFIPSIRAPLDKDALLLEAAIKKGSMSKFKKLALGEIRKSISLVRAKTAILIAIIIISGEQAIIGILGVLIPSFFEQVLEMDSSDASLILIAPLGIGMIIGGVLVGQLGHKYARRRLVSIGILVAGLLFLMIGLAPMIAPVVHNVRIPKSFLNQPIHSFILAVGSFFLGLAMVSVIVPTQTVIQAYTPEGVRGKIFAVLSATMSAVAIVPILLIGPITDLVGPSIVFVVMGLCIMIFGVVAHKPKWIGIKHILTPALKEFFGL